mmetsp:Transcript_12145/g.28818  ORF Transcript_12145/g.28818 Transcript_12145/m.28818 type:complete len:206 (-) Transcript_12145:44-661(-)
MLEGVGVDSLLDQFRLALIEHVVEFFAGLRSVRLEGVPGLLHFGRGGICAGAALGRWWFAARRCFGRGRRRHSCRLFGRRSAGLRAGGGSFPLGRRFPLFDESLGRRSDLGVLFELRNDGPDQGFAENLEVDVVERIELLQHVSKRFHIFVGQRPHRCHLFGHGPLDHVDLFYGSARHVGPNSDKNPLVYTGRSAQALLEVGWRE